MCGHTHLDPHARTRTHTHTHTCTYVYTDTRSDTRSTFPPNCTTHKLTPTRNRVHGLPLRLVDRAANVSGYVVTNDFGSGGGYHPDDETVEDVAQLPPFVFPYADDSAGVKNTLVIVRGDRSGQFIEQTLTQLRPYAALAVFEDTRAVAQVIRNSEQWVYWSSRDPIFTNFIHTLDKAPLMLDELKSRQRADRDHHKGMSTLGKHSLRHAQRPRV